MFSVMILHLDMSSRLGTIISYVLGNCS